MIARTAPAAAPASAFIAVSLTCLVARDTRLVARDTRPLPVAALRRLVFAFDFFAVGRFFVLAIRISRLRVT